MKDEVEGRVPETEELDYAPTSVEEEQEVRYDRLRRHPQFHSNILSTDRDIIVYVPEGYDESDRRYPVLYLHDGQNLFDRKTAYVPGRIWAVHETADRLIAEGAVEPLIIVGIYNTGAHRLAEYTPTRNPKMGGGDADLYGLMLIEEVKPFIDNEYRTLPDRENTGLGGSSLGGLVTLFLGLAHPEVFGKLAVLSPSVWWDHKSILAFVNEAEIEIRPRIWLDMGTREGGKSSLNDSVLLHKLLLKRGWRDHEDLLYMRVEGGTHDEEAWAKRVEPFLRFLFPARQ